MLQINKIKDFDVILPVKYNLQKNEKQKNIVLFFKSEDVFFFLLHY
jgi:hypothetical protein